MSPREREDKAITPLDGASRERRANSAVLRIGTVEYRDSPSAAPKGRRSHSSPPTSRHGGVSESKSAGRAKGLMDEGYGGFDRDFAHCEADSSAPSVAVIGGGIAGCTTAIALADKGYKVTVFERNPRVLCETSAATPCRFGIGIHYAGDLLSAILNLIAVIGILRYLDKQYGDSFQVSHPGGHDTRTLNLIHYVVAKKSTIKLAVVLENLEKLKVYYGELVAKDPANKVLGPVEDFYRQLDPDEIKEKFGSSFALAHFSSEDLNTLKSLEKTHWESQDEYTPELFGKVQAVEEAGEQYKQACFTTEEVTFLQRLLSENGQEALSLKLLFPTLNLENVETVIETAETMFNWPVFGPFLDGKLRGKAGITLKENTGVVSLSRTDYESQTTLETDRGEKFHFDLVVNAAWADVDRLLNTAGYKTGLDTINRWKVMAVVELPPSLRNRSFMVGFGPFCSLSAPRLGYLTYEPETNIGQECSVDTDSKATWEELRGWSEERKKDKVARIIKGAEAYIPAVRECKYVGLMVGPVRTDGGPIDIGRVDKRFYCRRETGVHSVVPGLIVNEARKHTYWYINSQIVLKLVVGMRILSVLHRCIMDEISAVSGIEQKLCMRYLMYAIGIGFMSVLEDEVRHGDFDSHQWQERLLEARSSEENTLKLMRVFGLRVGMFAQMHHHSVVMHELEERSVRLEK